MAKIGYGYGSEWQLLRMLGRHRNYFNELVLKSINKKHSELNSNIEWLDFDFYGWKDKEIIGLDFLTKEEKAKSNDNPRKKCLKQQNWDSIGKIGDTYILVEAKGNLDEFNKSDPGKAKGNSMPIIKSSIDKVITNHSLKNTNNKIWMGKGCYQTANRIIAYDYITKVLKKNAIILYVLFLNDWECSYYPSTNSLSKKGVKDIKEWDIITNEKFVKMGIKGSDIENNIVFVYPNCSI